MTDDEADRRIRAALDAIAKNTPDDYQLPASFWARINQEVPREATHPSDADDRPSVHRRSHPARGMSTRQRVATLVSLAAVIALVVMVLQPWSLLRNRGQATVTGPAVTPSPSPSASKTPGPDTRNLCPPGPQVHPTRVVQAAGDTGSGLYVSAPPELQDFANGDILTLESTAFQRLTEVGGCVHAYRLSEGVRPPADSTRIQGAPMQARSRVTADGVTQVFITQMGGTFMALSGNVGAKDLAVTLAAALTRP